MCEHPREEMKAFSASMALFQSRRKISVVLHIKQMQEATPVQLY